MNDILPDRWAVMIGDAVHQVTVVPAKGGFEIEIGGRHLRLETDWDIGETILEGRIDGQSLTVQVDRVGTGYRLFHSGAEQAYEGGHPAHRRTRSAQMPVKAPPDTSRFLLSPMPDCSRRLPWNRASKSRPAKPWRWSRR